MSKQTEDDPSITAGTSFKLLFEGFEVNGPEIVACTPELNVPKLKGGQSAAEARISFGNTTGWSSSGSSTNLDSFSRLSCCKFAAVDDTFPFRSTEPFAKDEREQLSLPKIGG